MALGMIEVYGYLAAVEALDSGLKAANVKLLDVTLVQGGLVTVLVSGDIGAVKAAMDASRTAAERVGKVVSVHVIPRPSKEIDKIITPYSLNIPCTEKKEEKKEEKIEENKTDSISYGSQSDINTTKDNKEALTPDKLQTMTVDKLRKLAREIRITNMTNKEIRFGTKNELIRSISEFIEQER